MLERSFGFRDILNSERIGCEVEVRTVRDANMDNDGENSQPNGEEEIDICDDIYGDLESAVFSSAPSKKRSIKSREELDDRISELLSKNSEYKERVTALSRENLNLKRNFSSLLRTAKEERNKNARILTDLRNELKQIVSLNKRGIVASKEETSRLDKYCNDVDRSVQSEICIDVVRKALDDSKKSRSKEKQAQLKTPWRKRLKFDNISVYFSREQIPFSRQETVTWPVQS